MTAATMKVFYDWGGTVNAPGTAHNVTDNGSNKVRFKTADDADIDANNPIPVPSSGVNRSYWKQIYLQCTAIQDATQIDNIKFYSDGAAFDGYTQVDLAIGDETPTKTSVSDAGYDLPSGTAATSGEIMTNHSDITGTTNVTTKTSGSPLSVSISEASSQIDATSETTDYVVLQMRVGTSADSGTLTAETLTYKYDEV